MFPVSKQKTVMVMELKSQDSLIAVAIWSLQNDKKVMSIRELAAWLGVSQGEISKGAKRLIGAGLLVDRGGQWHPQVNALLEWLSYGVRYAYPIKQSGFGRGVPTAWNCPHIHSELVAPVPAYVWSRPGGEVEGVIIEPIHPKVPQSAIDDLGTYQVMALVDAIRMGKPRELAIARKELKALLEGIYE
ncbi:hypothetical protein NBRC116493_22100 [Aurantivibrio infirmus]